MDKNHHKDLLIRILKMAHAGELAAAWAYRGHWNAVTDPYEITGIQRIEMEEWIHRADVGKMLAHLGQGPDPLKERKMGLIGHTVEFLCGVTGWFFPMYIAGWLEHQNVDEYATAAFHAGQLGLRRMEGQLLDMAHTEKEHENFFMERVEGHPLLPLVQGVMKWGPMKKEVQQWKPF